MHWIKIQIPNWKVWSELCFRPQSNFNSLTIVNRLSGNHISEELKTLIRAQVDKEPLSQNQQELLVKCVRQVTVAKSKEQLFILASTKSAKRVGIHSPIKLVPSDLIRELAKFFV